MLRLPPYCLLPLLLAPAFAAGPREGIATVAAEAQLRLPGSELVEIEGFTDPEGDIPCSAKALGNVWHYKFYSSAEDKWLIANGCGDIFMNAAENRPYPKTDEPTKPLPAAFADATDVLDRLDKAGVFQPAGGTKSREILMNVRYLPARDGRPEGCYWTVSLGKRKVFMDCAGKKHWAGGQRAGKTLVPVKGPAGKDTARKYIRTAYDTVQAKFPGADLMGISATVSAKGDPICVNDRDGWTYKFRPKTADMEITFSACRGKTETLTQPGWNGSDHSTAPMPTEFVDSDTVISRLPAQCHAAHSSLMLGLASYKGGHFPVPGHDLVWSALCGGKLHYVDGHTGAYLGAKEN